MEILKTSLTPLQAELEKLKTETGEIREEIREAEERSREITYSIREMEQRIAPLEVVFLLYKCTRSAQEIICLICLHLKLKEKTIF